MNINFEVNVDMGRSLFVCIHYAECSHGQILIRIDQEDLDYCVSAGPIMQRSSAGTWIRVRAPTFYFKAFALNQEQSMDFHTVHTHCCTLWPWMILVMPELRLLSTFVGESFWLSQSLSVYPVWWQSEDSHVVTSGSQTWACAWFERAKTYISSKLTDLLRTQCNILGNLMYQYFCLWNKRHESAVCVNNWACSYARPVLFF